MSLPAPGDGILSRNLKRFVSDTGAQRLHDVDAAFDPSSEDRIILPKRDRFPTTQGYAGTAANELVPRSGAEVRLDRNLTGPVQDARQRPAS